LSKLIPECFKTLPPPERTNTIVFHFPTVRSTANYL